MMKDTTRNFFFDVYQDTEKTYCSQRIMPPFPGMAPIAGWRHNGRAGRRNREQITVEQKFISGFQQSRGRPEAGTGTKGRAEQGTDKRRA